MKIFAELSEDEKRIELHFRYDPQLIQMLKGEGGHSGISGRKFVPREKGGPYWTVPLDLVTGQRLRETFGQALVLGDALKAWGRDEVKRQRNLSSLAVADTATLEHLPHIHRNLYDFIAKRPYQLADVALMSQANVLNANQPGTGKTIETIASWIEGGLWEAQHLVIAPVRSLENVWLEELAWSGLDIYTAEEPRERREQVAWGCEAAQQGKHVVVALNPDMIRLKLVWNVKSKNEPPKDFACKDYKGNIYDYKDDLQRLIFSIDWKTICVDEFHKHGMRNRRSQFYVGCSHLIRPKQRRHALSGTPMGGVVRSLWPTLHWLEPEEYSSEWKWIGDWLETEAGYGNSKIVGGIQPGREEAFYKAHARHMVRRLKRDALPGLPPQVHIPVLCNMTPAQKKQYQKFEADAEIRIDEERLSATNVLAEYSRLKQFANAKQEMRDGVPYPTTDSGKLLQLEEKLDEEGIRTDQPEPKARAIIASYSSRFVMMVADWLKGKGIDCDTLTGATKDSKPLIKKFNSPDKHPDPYVLVMTAQTGGVSLNLEAAGSIHLLDEDWNPDNDEQMFDRGDRGSRTEPLRCYTYRTKNSIQTKIHEVSEFKIITNKNVLDLHRKLVKA